MKSGYDKNTYLLKNTLLFAIGNFGTKLINFLMVPLYSYVLSTAEYGTIDLISTILSVLMPVVTLNISEAVQRFSLDKNANYGQIYTNSMLINLSGILFLILLYPAIDYCFIDSHTPLILIIYISFYSLYMSTTCMLRGREELVKYTICNILLTVLICLQNILFLVYLNMGLNGYFLAYALSYGIVSLIAFFLGKQWKYISFQNINTKFTKKMAAFSMALVPNAFLWWIVNSSDRIMVANFCGYAENGLYAMAYKIPSLLSVISSIFMQAWGFSAIREKNDDNECVYHNTVFQNLSVFMGIAAIGMMLILKPAVNLLLSEGYAESWKYSPFLLVGFVFVSMASFAGTTYYVNKNSLRQMLSAIGGAIINIVLNVILIPNIGPNGASIATCISYASILLYRVYDTRDEVRLDIFNSRITYTVGLLIISTLVIYIDDIFVSELLILIVFILSVYINRGFIKQFFVRLFQKKQQEENRK